ncbi:metallophosphoesterase [Streptomyces capparidis]
MRPALVSLLAPLGRALPAGRGPGRAARRGEVPLGPLEGERHPYRRAAVLAVVAAAGAWLGLVVVGAVHVPVGPVDTRMSLHPSWSGGTNINVPPLGSLGLSSHHGPVRLDVDVRRLDPVRAQAIVNHPERLEGLEDEVADDVRAGAFRLLWRSSLAVAAGAVAVGLVVYRRPRRALAAGGLALLLLAASGATAFATLNPKSVLEPRYSGLLRSAPSVVGDARSVVSDFDVYSQELARLVTNVTRLYDTTTTLPAYSPDPSTLRVLHVSDIHLNPAAWELIRATVEDYSVDVIIDTGDTMDHGTEPENRFLDPVADLGAPYVWVRGNHDSAVTQAYLEGLENTHVVDDGRVAEVAGLRVAGVGDPQFTPDRSAEAAGDPAERAAGRELAGAIRAQAEPVDIALAHNPEAAKETDGAVPLALAGHTHKRSTAVLEEGTRLMVQGSTGGGGLRAVEGDTPQEVQMSVLYLDRDTHRLQAWDDITLGGLGLTTAEITRHLPEEDRRGREEPPPPSGSGSPSGAGRPGAG